MPSVDEFVKWWYLKFAGCKKDTSDNFIGTRRVLLEYNVPHVIRVFWILNAVLRVPGPKEESVGNALS